MFKGKKKKAEAEAAAAAAAAAGGEDAAAKPESEGAEGEDASAPVKKKLPLKLIIIAAVALLVVGGGGGTAAFIFLKPKPALAADGQEAKPKKKKKDGEHASKKEGGEGGGLVREGPEGVTYYTMPDIMVNMQTTTGRPALLKLKLTFETKDEHAIDSMDPNLPRLNDTLETFLRELRPEDLAGSQGSYALRMEIERRVNLVIAPSKIDAVRIEDQLIN